MHPFPLLSYLSFNKMWIDSCCVLFASGLLLLITHFVWGFSMSHVAVHSFSLLCRLQLHYFINFPILLFVNTRVASIWGLLWIMLLRICLPMLFLVKKCIYSFTSLGHILMGGFGRSYDNNTVSLPLMLSIGSVTLNETAFNNTNFYHRLIDINKS